MQDKLHSHLPPSEKTHSIHVNDVAKVNDVAALSSAQPRKEAISSAVSENHAHLGKGKDN